MEKESTQTFIVEQDQVGTRLDRFLVAVLPEYSRAQIQKVIKSGKALVNEKKSTPHLLLQVGDRVTFAVAEKPTMKAVPEIEIVSETPDYLVINKPSGIVVHPDSRHINGTVVNFLIQKYPEIAKVGDDPNRPGIVHRLDKDASGLLLVARTQPAFEYFKQQFQDHFVEKEYVVLVHGRGLEKSGEINSAIARSKSGKMVARASVKRVADLFKDQDHDRGKDALTLYQVLEERGSYTLLSVRTKTGRTHQIRVHFYSIGHSVVGDSLYRNKKHIMPPSHKCRLFLHARRLAFHDPKGEYRDFSLTLAKDLESFWDTLQKA